MMFSDLGSGIFRVSDGDRVLFSGTIAEFRTWLILPGRSPMELFENGIMGRPATAIELLDRLSKTNPAPDRSPDNAPVRIPNQRRSDEPRRRGRSID